MKHTLRGLAPLLYDEATANPWRLPSQPAPSMLRLPLRFVAHALLLLLLPICGFAQNVPNDVQIAAATAPLPDEYRDGALVMGYRDGNLEVIRPGTNDMVCLADRPGDERYHAACYHSALEPFMVRGRVLRAEGKSDDEVRLLREEEARAGTLAMPDGPAALYSLTGPSEVLDPATGAVTGAAMLYVVYLPYATEAETGLSTIPAPGKPWLMDAGKPWAHIMLMPPRPDSE